MVIDNDDKIKGLKKLVYAVHETDTKVTKIDGDKIYIAGREKGVLEGVNHIIIATGMKSYNPLEEKLRGKLPVYVIGDAKQVGKAKDAIESAFDLASKL